MGTMGTAVGVIAGFLSTMSQMSNRPHNPNPVLQQCLNCPIRTLHTATPKGTKLLLQRKLDIHTETEIICKYCQGASSKTLGPCYKIDATSIPNILRRYGQTPRTYKTAQRNRHHSRILQFPLSPQVSSLVENPECKPYLRHIIAVSLIAEGAAGHRQDGHPYVTFTNKAESLHAIFADLVYHAYSIEPSAYYQAYWSRAGKQGAKAYYTTYFRRHDTETILQDLLKLTPVFRTRPKRGQSWGDYLKEPLQPTLQFLLRDDIPEAIAVFALRLAMSAEGTISPIFRHDAQYPYPHLAFGCSHPILQRDWQSFFARQGITFHLTTAMLESAVIQVSERFLEIGGFLSGVRIRENSYYHDIDRQDLLKAILIGRKDFPIDPALPLKEKHILLRKRAINIGR
jgi:hypothetical protein